MRYTKKDVEGMFKRLVRVMRKHEDKGLTLDYIACYGGYVIEESMPNGGVNHPFGNIRRTAKEMYLSMYMAAQVLEDFKHKELK